MDTTSFFNRFKGASTLHMAKLTYKTLIDELKYDPNKAEILTIIIGENYENKNIKIWQLEICSENTLNQLGLNGDMEDIRLPLKNAYINTYGIIIPKSKHIYEYETPWYIKYLRGH